MTIISGDNKKTQLTLVKPSVDQEQLDALRVMPAKRRMDSIVADRNGARLVRALYPQELYWTAKEIGNIDALPLLEMASTEQLIFFLDMELWRGWEFDSHKAIEWLGLLKEFSESVILDLIDAMDIEMLVMMLQREIIVGGGVGDMVGDEERSYEWDHSFDQVFMITFRNKENSDLVKWFIDLLYRYNQPFYRHIMECVKNEVATELEELCLQFRNSRLSDLGFPAPDDARLIYAPIQPARFIPSTAKEPVVTDGIPPVILDADNTLLGRAIAIAGEGVRVELGYLLNNALMAESSEHAEKETVRGVMERVKGRLNIALEYLCSSELEKGVQILEQESLAQLFRLGCGILADLRRRATETESADFVVNRLLTGLRRERPVFYRGLDEDGFDSYREFATMEEVRRIEGILARLS
jgi:hypothetical protein